MKYLFMFSLVFFSIAACANVYMRTDQNGNVTYSDTFTPGAKIMPLPENNLPTDKSASTKQTTNKMATDQSADAEPATANSVYSQFLIDTPLDKQTINNQQEIPVTVVTTPELQKGDMVQVYLDGKAQGSPAAKNFFNLLNVERGEHQVYAVIQDQNGQVLKRSQTITIFTHYAHVGGAPGAT